MKVLVVGGGGREHALCVALAKSPKVDTIFCAPGNGGIAAIAECRPDLLVSDLEGLVAFAKDASVDLTVVGPEAPLVAGIVDRFQEEGLRIFGPPKAAARLEGSKDFAKQVMLKNNIPTAAHHTFSELAEAKEYVEQNDVYPVVVKADGLAAGKGVTVCETREATIAAVEESMGARRFGDAGAIVVIEEFLRGEEASVHAITDGETLLVLPSAQDHKRVGEGDTGPNTGGMGAYSPAPVVEGEMMDRIVRTVLVPTLHGMKRAGTPFRGVLYAGLMITRGGPRVLEYNVRFGDPETQVLFPRMKSDLFDILSAAADGDLSSIEGLDLDERPCVGVVVASEGYPGPYQGGKEIAGLEAADALEDVVVYHAGTRLSGDRIVTAGGRVLCVSALGDDFQAARDRAYEGVDAIHFTGASVRRDIGWRVLART